MKKILIKDLEPGQKYLLQARARDTSGRTSPWSTAFEVLTMSDVIAPSPVTGLTWEVTGTSFLGKWTKPTTNSDASALKDFKDYKVIITAGSENVTYYVTQEKFDFTFEMNLASFGDPEPSLQISVQARDLVGNLSTAVTSTVSNPVPPNITNFTADSVLKGVNLTWDTITVEDFKQYEVYMSTSSSGFTPDASNRVYVGTSDYLFFSTENPVVHYFKIRAVDVFNQGSAAYAAASGTPELTTDLDVTPPGAPSSVTVSTNSASDGSSNIVVSWSAVSSPNLSDYIVRYSTDQVAWKYITVPSSQTSATISNLLPSTTYYVGVASESFVNAKSAFTNAGTYPITTAADTTAPSTPAAPTVSVSTLAALVNHDMTKASGGNLEADVDYLEVHASVTTGFTPSASTRRGVIEVSAPGVAVSGVFYYGATDTTTNLYWKVIAVDRAGNKSAASAQATGVPGLLQGVNIVDASINAAKINSLNANSIIAGTGIINDLLIKSNLTIDTAGHVKSTNYNVGAQTGWTLDTTGLTIYDGSIYAKSLLLQDSQNIMPPAFADFEFNSDYYHNSAGVPNPATSTSISCSVGITTTELRFNRQSIRIYNQSLPTGIGNACYYIMSIDASASTNFNMQVDPGVYIYSFYAKKNTGYNSNVVPGFLWEGAGTTGTTHVVNSATWTRFSGTFTVPSAKQKLKMYFLIYATDQTGVDLFIDGIQIERKLGGLNTPSEFKPPSQTYIDGGAIVTGSIRSSASSATVAGQPAWSINTAGNMQIGDAAIRGSMVVGSNATPVNLVPVNLASFEQTSSYYHDGSNNPNTTNINPGSPYKLQILGSGAQHGSQALRVFNTTQASGVTSNFFLSKVNNSPTGNNINVIAGQIYIISVYVKSNNVAQSQTIQLAAYPDNTNFVYLGSPFNITSTSYTRISASWTAPIGYNNMQIVFGVKTTGASTGFDFVIDAIQMEQAVAGQSSPTTFSLGTDGSSYVKSINYLSGVSGWIINSEGNVEFNDATLRGRLDIVSLLDGEEYRVRAQNQLTTWKSNSPSEISGVEPSILFTGNKFTPAAGGGADPGDPIQAVMRMSPEGGLQIIMDSSNNSRLFDVDANNDLTSSYTPIDDYYGYSEIRGGPGAFRDFTAAFSSETNSHYDNDQYVQLTAKSIAPVEIGGGSRTEVSILANTDASTSNFYYNPQSIMRISAATDTIINSDNIIPDPWDVFDGTISTYNTGSNKNRVTLNSIGDMVNTLKHGTIKGINASLTVAGSGDPFVWFAPTATSYNVTVEPLAKYSMALAMAWEAAADTANLQMQFICKLSNGTILSSTPQDIHDDFGVLGPTFYMASNSDVFSIPAGITTAQFGFRILNHNNAVHNFKFAAGRLYKTFETNGKKRSSYNAYDIMSREQVISERNQLDIGMFVSAGYQQGSVMELSATKYDLPSSTNFKQFSMKISTNGMQWGPMVEYRMPMGGSWEYTGMSTVTPNSTNPTIVPFGAQADPTFQTKNLTWSNGDVRNSIYYDIHDPSAVFTNPSSAGWLFTAPRAGLWLGCCSIINNTTAAGLYLDVYNHTTLTRYSLDAPLPGGIAGDISSTGIVPASAGDKLGFRFWNFSGANVTTTALRFSWIQLA